MPPGVASRGHVHQVKRRETEEIPEWSLWTLTVDQASDKYTPIGRMLGACCLKIRNPVNRVYCRGAKKNPERIDFAMSPATGLCGEVGKDDRR